MKNKKITILIILLLLIWALSSIIVFGYRLQVLNDILFNMEVSVDETQLKPEYREAYDEIYSQDLNDTKKLELFLSSFGLTYTESGKVDNFPDCRNFFETNKESIYSKDSKYIDNELNIHMENNKERAQQTRISILVNGQDAEGNIYPLSNEDVVFYLDKLNSIKGLSLFSPINKKLIELPYKGTQTYNKMEYSTFLLDVNDFKETFLLMSALDSEQNIFSYQFRNVSEAIPDYIKSSLLLSGQEKVEYFKYKINVPANKELSFQDYSELKELKDILGKEKATAPVYGNLRLDFKLKNEALKMDSINFKVIVEGYDYIDEDISDWSILEEKDISIKIK